MIPLLSSLGRGLGSSDLGLTLASQLSWHISAHVTRPLSAQVVFPRDRALHGWRHVCQTDDEFVGTCEHNTAQNSRRRHTSPSLHAAPLLSCRIESALQPDESVKNGNKRSKNFDKRTNSRQKNLPMKKIELRENRTANASPLNAGSVIYIAASVRGRPSVLKEAVVGQQFIARLDATRLSDFIAVMNLFGGICCVRYA